MEDKVYTVMFLKKALQADCQCISAFNKLLGNYLIGKEDCIMLLNEMHFTKESMWLKDYYLSRIQLEIRPMREQEGVLSIKAIDEQSSHLLYMPSD
jgi:hypothetical protein